METPATGGTPAGDTSADARRTWRFLLRPKWLAWHATVVIAFCAMLWMGNWQFGRAIGGNGLSWAYTFEWPLFAVFAVVFWAKTVRDEIRIRTGKIPDPKVINALLEAAAEARALASIDPSRPRAITAGSSAPGLLGMAQADGYEYEFDDDEPEDEELARYNARLAQLAREDIAKRKARGTRR